jgi:3-mercaptopyruvate sulfurtransferase SseA
MPALDSEQCAVTAIEAADAAEAVRHFENLLRFETDCWDVHESIDKGRFVLLDVRSPEAYAKGHVPGAVNLPHRKITERALETYPTGTTFVVYCNGPHCNGAELYDWQSSGGRSRR